ncbi:rho GTPase-activating protein 39 isoform X2 [Nematostella vectensis]|nr:rho GTPase-activating protein 39 isoform X2 [Nematostella vectensis]
MVQNSTEHGVDEETAENTADAAARRDSQQDCTRSPETSRVPADEGARKERNGNGRGTPSGTLTRENRTSDDAVKRRRERSDVTPSGTLERDKETVTSPSGSFAGHTSVYDNLENVPPPESCPSSPDGPWEKPLTLNGEIQLDRHDRASSDESLSYRLQAGGMSPTTALLVEACAPPSGVTRDDSALRSDTALRPENGYRSENGVRSLRTQRQTSDSAVALAYREEQERANNLLVQGSSSTLPRLSRPSSIATTQGSPSHHSSLERSHSVPSGKPLFRGLGAYESYLNQHTKGLFRRKRVSLASMMSWSKVPIKKPLILMSDRQLKKDAVDVFKLILGYMGDRPIRVKTTRDIALDICTRGWETPLIRDEIYLQICKQTTDNGNSESLRRGWELMSICLTLFPPSTKFHSYLEGYITRHLNCEDDNLEVDISDYPRYCHKQLAKISKTGAKRGLRKPTPDDIQQAEYHVFHPSMFGATLEDIMQRQESDFPSLKLPWILTTLAEAVLHHDGARTEGIFRVPGDIDEVNALKLRLDRYEPPDNVSDPHVPASLLKLWFRELNDPLIPAEYYEKCIMNCDDATVATALILSLPEINRLVLSYLIRFLQIFSLMEVSSLTKMDVNNLAMVWAPNCLRNPSDNLQEVWENTRREMTFVRTLLWNLDTSYMEGVH